MHTSSNRHCHFQQSPEEFYGHRIENHRMANSSFNYQQCINKQVSILKEFFYNQINSDYVYLDIPGHMNVGDHLIALGAWELLKEMPFKCLTKSTFSGFNWTVEPKAIILLHGGGNFGDLYPGANWFRNEIVRRFPDHKIIFLPQTITYNDKSLISKDAQICAKHTDLHICARDYESYRLLNDHFHSNHIYLLPDTAWGLYERLKKKQEPRGQRKSILINRADSERNGSWDVKADDVMDWPEILEATHISPWIKFHSIINKLRKHFGSHLFRRISDIYLIRIIYPLILSRINRFFLEYDHVFTTRLHGLIFSIMLHLPVEWIDTKYGKISSYANTWLIPE